MADTVLVNYNGRNLQADLVVSPGGGGGGGGAATIADGADTAEGSTTDAAYSSSTGATAGTVVSLLKGLYVALRTQTQSNSVGNGADVAEGNTADTAYSSADGSAAGTVVGLLKGAFVALKGILSVGGNVASGVTDSGNPIKTGGYASSAPPTAVAAGQRANNWLTLNGAQVIATGIGQNGLDGFGNAGGSLFRNADGSSGIPFIFNLNYNPGTSDWRRQRGDDNGTWIVGPAAEGSALAGNPQRMGGSDGTNIRTLSVTTGGALNIGSIASALPAGTNTLGGVNLQVGSTALVALADNADAIATVSTATGLRVQSRGSVFNGTTWDRARGDTNGAWAVSKGSSNIATAQVSVATTATLIAAARTGRGSVKITNVTGAQQIFIGGSGVTTTTGDLLPATVGASVTIPSNAAVYGIAVTAAQTVSVMEVY